MGTVSPYVVLKTCRRSNLFSTHMHIINIRQAENSQINNMKSVLLM